jgi:hypothetical protein
MKLRLVFGSLCLCSTSVLFAWGQKGHQLVNEVAIDMVSTPEARRFLSANAPQFIKFASTPDVRWKDGRNSDLEKKTHFFQMEDYSSTNMGDDLADAGVTNALKKLGRPFMDKNGYAMWRVGGLYQLVVESLGKNDFKRAIQAAGTLGHYIGDVTQPMHVTKNYDGQSIGRRGIHSYYETNLVGRLNGEKLRNKATVTAGQIRSDLEREVGNDLNEVDVRYKTYTICRQAHEDLELVLEHFSSSSQDDQALSEDLEPRLAQASAMLGKLLDSAFVSSGVDLKRLPKQNLNVPEPEWIPFSL